jgi:hypothetical protein
MSEKNPLLEQENYYAGYEESIKNLRNNPELVEIDKLCYLVFNTPDGKKLMDIFIERYVIPGFVNPSSASPGDSALYYEGFKEFIRMIRSCIKSHEQRIQAESVRQVESKQ